MLIACGQCTFVPLLHCNRDNIFCMSKRQSADSFEAVGFEAVGFDSHSKETPSVLLLISVRD